METELNNTYENKCEVCAEYFVCWAYDKLGRENCEDFRPGPDFLTYQEKMEKQQ